MVEEVNSNKIFSPLVQQQQQNLGLGAAKSDKFVDAMKEFVSDTNTLQVDSAEMTEKLIKGEPVDIHDVMIAAEKAKTTFNLLVEMRDKFVDLYKEVQRLQV